MAGAEKICEFSGEYPGWLMYNYKRHQLQIMPEYRKLFRGAKHTLHIYPSDERVIFKDGSSMDANMFFRGMDYWTPNFTDKKEFLKFSKACLVKEYYYVLQVEDEKLFGNVDGKYLNWSIHLPTVKRKLKRMLRCKELNIVYHNKKYGE